MSESFDLSRFLPHRLSVLINTISQAIAADYQQRFGLSVTQWRVMAVLGQQDDLLSREVAERTAMDKVAVSRAVSGLVKRRLVSRRVSRHDRRENPLRLTASGRAIHDQIVPVALAQERRLLAALSAEEEQCLRRLLDILQPQTAAPSSRADTDLDPTAC